MAKVVAALTIILLGLLGSVACNTSDYDDKAGGSSGAGLGCFLPGWMINNLALLPLCYDNKTPSLPSAGVNPDLHHPSENENLTVGYYDKAGSPRYCPKAKGIVREVVLKAIYEDPRIGAGLVRLFFHDCFVRGCDASVLLNTSDSTKPQETEMVGLPNINSLRALSNKVIHDAKAKIEEACPRRVSCADIVAFAASDASYFLSGREIDIKMPAGRLDGRVSSKAEAEQNLPGPFDSFNVLAGNFENHSLTVDHLVALSGAHSFGEARCRFSANRLPPNSTDEQRMDAGFARELSANCTRGGGDDFRVNQDSVTPDKLDNQYYKNVKAHKVLFTSDATLYSSDNDRLRVRAKNLVDGFAKDTPEWYRKFEEAMVKMGELRDKTVNRPKQEIREKCWIYNPY